MYQSITLGNRFTALQKVRGLLLDVCLLSILDGGICMMLIRAVKAIHARSCMHCQPIVVLQMLGDLLLAHIRQLFEWVLPACLRFVRKNVKEIQPSLDTNLAQACMRLFYSLVDEFRPSGSEDAPVPPKGEFDMDMLHLALFAVPCLAPFHTAWYFYACWRLFDRHSKQLGCTAFKLYATWCANTAS